MIRRFLALLHPHRPPDAQVAEVFQAERDVEAFIRSRPVDADLTGWIVDEPGDPHCEHLMRAEPVMLLPFPPGYESPEGIAWETGTFRHAYRCAHCPRIEHKDRSEQI